MSNFVASAHNRIQAIEEELSRRDLHIDTLQARLRVLQSEINNAKHARKKLDDERKKIFADIAPISTVPYEILSNILRLACEWEQPPPPPIAYDDDHAPVNEHDPVPFVMRLSHVNRHFRHVAISTAALWSRIHVTLRGNSRGVGQARYRARLMAARAQSQLLDITLIARNSWNKPHHICSILMILSPVSRWRSLRLDCEMTHTMIMALHLFTQSAPNLRRLQLQTEWGHDIGYAPTPFSGNVPLLSSLSLFAIPLSWDTQMLAGLTELELMFIEHEHQPRIQQLLHILQLSPGLKRLVLLGGGPWIHKYDGEPALICDNLPSVTMDALQDITLGELEPEAISLLYEALSMPALRSLSLDSWRDWENPDYEDQLDILKRRHSSTLRRLKLIGVPVENPRDFARHFPGLEELELHEGYDFLQHITTPAHGSAAPPEIFFPRLDCIKWSGHDIFPLCVFLRTRRALGFGPSKVMLNTQRTSNHHAVEDMRSLVSIEYFTGTERDKIVAERLDDYARSDVLMEMHEFYGASDEELDDLVAMDWPTTSFGL